MNIGLLGLSANPIHNGHIYVAEKAIKDLNLDKLYVLPCGKNPLVNKPMADYITRFSWTSDAFENNPKVKVIFSEYVYFVEVLCQVVARVEKDNETNEWNKYFVIVGSDEYQELQMNMSWRASPLIHKICGVYLVDRPEGAISSSQIRKWFVQGNLLEIEKVVPASVYDELVEDYQDGWLSSYWKQKKQKKQRKESK